MPLKLDPETAKKLAPLDKSVDDIARAPTAEEIWAVARKESETNSHDLKVIDQEGYDDWMKQLRARNALIGHESFHRDEAQSAEPQYVGEVTESVIGEAELDEHGVSISNSVNISMDSMEDELSKKAQEDYDNDSEALIPGSEEFDQRFIDLAVVENTYKRLTDQGNLDDIFAELDKAFFEAHEIEGYETTLDVNACVEELKKGVSLLSGKSLMNPLLTHKKD